MCPLRWDSAKESRGVQTVLSYVCGWGGGLCSELGWLGWRALQ